MLVAAPTGSGKTIVGEFAIHLALQTGRKAFYTTPIKALSNQKYHDLVKRYGAGERRPAHRRQRRQRRGAGGRDDHRGAAQHAVRRLAHAARPGLRRDGRGALPRRPDARRGLGGGHHPPPRVGDAGVAVGDRLQRRGVRRVAGDRPRRDHHDPRGEAAGAALPARHGRAPAARPVRLLRRRRERRLRQGGRAGQRGAHPDRPRRLGQHAADARPQVAPQGQARVVEEPPRRRQRPSRVDPEPRRRRRAARPRGPAAGDHVHLQPGRLRRGRDPARAGQHPAHHRRRARRDLRPRRGGVALAARGGPARPRLPRVPRRPHPRHRRPPRRPAARLQAGRGGAVPGGAGQGRLRDRDPRPRHQHARPHGGHREAVEVERRDATPT